MENDMSRIVVKTHHHTHIWYPFCLFVFGNEAKRNNLQNANRNINKYSKGNS